MTTEKERSRKPFIYWCRWSAAVMRLQGKDATTIWGEVEYYADDIPSQEFHFDLHTWVLTIGSEPNQEVIELDEMGIKVLESPE